MTWPTLGWNPEDEAKHAEAMRALTIRVSADLRPVGEVPERYDTAWLRPENQGGTSSCCGHALSACGEGCYQIANRGEITQFSRRAAYAWAKATDNSPANQDAGATIGAAVIVANRIGFAPEALVPWYPGGQFQPGVPNEAEAKRAAEAFRVRAVGDIRNYDELDRWCTSGAGWVVSGWLWTTGWGGMAGQEFLDFLPGGRALGGHALAIGGWITRGGERWYGIHNSHGAEWGTQGRVWCSPRVMDGLIRGSQFGFKGISDMASPEPRPMDWTKVSFG